MFSFDNITNEYNNKHNKKWPFIPDHPYKMLITGGSGSGKTNALLNLMKKNIVTILLARFICMQKI